MFEDIVGKYWEESGKGRKYCPSCHKYIPARSQECPVCDMQFVQGETYEPTSSIAIEDSPYADYVKYWVDKLGIDFRVTHLVYTPKGGCPIFLPSTKSDDLRNWTIDVISEGVKEGKLYYIDALIYWLRQFVDLHSPEFKAARNRITEIFAVDFGIPPVTMEKVTYEKPRRMWEEEQGVIT